MAFSLGRIFSVNVHIAAKLNIKHEDSIKIVSVLETLLKNVTVDNKKITSINAFLQAIKTSAWGRLLDHFAAIEKSKDYLKQTPHKKTCNLTIKEIGLMVGATRQLLLWQKGHFKIFKSMLDCYHIDQSVFKAVAANKTTQDVYKFASICQIPVISLKEVGGDFQLDAVRSRGMRVESRVVISSVKNSVHSIRSSHELVLALCIYVVENLIIYH